MKKIFKNQVSPLRYTLLDYINSVDFIVRSMEEGKSTIPPPEVVSEKEDLEDHEMVKLDLDFNKIETLGGRKNKPH